jgi:protein-S-isoprenylcysteine O-methyltransferase Ste14
MRLIDMRPPRIALFLTIFAAALHWGFHHGEQVNFFLPGTGTSVGMAGFTLMMWAWLIFKNQDLAVCLPGITNQITKSGPYRFSRNPMYLGMFLMMLGLALVIGTLPFYLSAVGFFAIMHFLFCPFEEKKLAHAFGRQYEQYRNEVHRWL